MHRICTLLFCISSHAVVVVAALRETYQNKNMLFMKCFITKRCRSVKKYTYVDPSYSTSLLWYVGVSNDRWVVS